jgi:hypothetical protein
MSPLFSYPAESPFITGAYVPCPTGCAPDCYTIVTPPRCEIYDYGVLKCCPLGWNRDDDPEGELCTLLGQQEYLDTAACLDNGLKVEWFALPVPSNKVHCQDAGGIWYPAVSQTICPSPSGVFCGVTFASPLPSNPPCYTCDISDELFLNCYVTGFSGKLGLGPTETSVTVELVEIGVNRPCDDPCPIMNLSNPLTSCDPLPSPIDNYQYNGMIGNIYSFNLGNFCFTGVLTNHRYSESSDGYRYSVTLTDARNVLSKTMVIVKGYYDDLPEELKPNVINIAYKLQTSVGDDNCGNGKRCDNFGEGMADQESVKLHDVIYQLNGEYCQIPISGTFLKINLNNIISLINSSSAFSNLTNKLEEDSLSVIDIVVRATEDIGYDFYCEIIGNEIVFKVINRSTQPTSKDLFNLLTSNGLSDACSNRDYGQELTFNPTKRLVRGQAVTYFSVIDGALSSDPEPSGNLCGRTLYPCFKQGYQTSDDIVYADENDKNKTKSDCLAYSDPNPDMLKAIWYGIDQVYEPGSFARRLYDYGTISGGPGDTVQDEIQDSIIIIDARYSAGEIIIYGSEENLSDTVNVINRNTVYRLQSDELANNNEYYVWGGPLPSEGYAGSFSLVTDQSYIPKKPTFPLPSPPNPSCSPYPTYGTQPTCNTITKPSGNILMYFGSEFKPDPGCTSPPCQSYTTIYVADGEDFKVMAHRQDANGHYVDYRYSCKELIDAGILPSNFNSVIVDDEEVGRPYFVLTEMELLHTSTFPSWTNFGILRDDNCSSPSFAWLCMKALEYDIDPLIKDAISSFHNISEDQLETMSFGYLTNSIVTPNKDYFTTPNPSNESLNYKTQRLETCYQWIKNIYDTYYGKQFLVKVADHNIYMDEEDPTPQSSPTMNICVKEFNRNYGSQTVEDVRKLPLVVSGNGENQGYLVSDQVSTNGGFPSEKFLNSNNANLLGLLDLNYISDISDNFLTNEGNIEPFIKFGRVSQNGELKKYTKFGWEYQVDLSLFNNENSYLKNGPLSLSGQPDYIDLYLRVSTNDELYFLLYKDRYPGSIYDSNISRDYGGSYALVIVQQPVSLIPTKILGFTRGLQFFIFLNPKLRTKIQELRSKSIANNELFDINKLFGAKPDYSILNLVSNQKMTLMPEGAAIALKSNLYCYGPYYHIKNRTGSAEIITEPDLYPAFFNNDPLFPSDSYEKMHNMGKRLCQDGVNGVQQVETGTYTIHNLPSLSLGYLTSNPQSPVLLNDMSVTFGSGGFSTTYNFETYTPRFGSPARHILDQYKVNKKEADYINSQRRIDKRNILNINRDINVKRWQQRNISGGEVWPGDIIPYKNKSTPNTLLITGFAFKGSVSPESSPAFSNNTNNTNLRPYIVSDTYDTLSSIINQTNPDTRCCTGSPLPSCISCSCEPSPSASTTPSPFPSHSGNIYTITTFAENRNSYDFGHLQETFGNLAVISVDSLYLPVSIRGGILSPQSSSSPNLNLYNKSISRYGDVGNSLSASKPKVPVFNYNSQTQYNLSINNKYLNPIVSRIMLVGANPSMDSWDSGWDSRRNETNKGFVINSIAFGDDFDKFRLSHNVESEFYRQNSSDFRFNAMRGPLVLQGWGYDTQGKPIPNHADNPSDTEVGNFYNKNLTDKFMKDWLRNPRTWPVGPIDLRFDRERKVWVCPPSDRIILAQLESALDGGGSATARLINIQSGSAGFYDGVDLWDKDGKNIKEDLKNTSITVYDYLGLKIKSKSLVYAYYDGSKYIVLNSRDRMTADDCCWYGLDVLKNVTSYDPEKKQALIHKPSYKDGITECPSCLSWEDIIECSPSPSPSPSCVCPNIELSMSNFNPGSSKINILFPYNVKDMGVVGNTNNVTYVTPEDPQCSDFAKFDLGAANAICTGQNGLLVKYELTFDIAYKKCCGVSPSYTFTDCADTITVKLTVNNLPGDCDCETGNQCQWQLVEVSTTNCEGVTSSIG